MKKKGLKFDKEKQKILDDFKKIEANIKYNTNYIEKIKYNIVDIIIGIFIIPIQSIIEEAKVLYLGAKKYKVNNWKNVNNARERYLNAGLRHLHAYANGEKIDQDLKTLHLANAKACLSFLIWFDEKENK